MAARNDSVGNDRDGADAVARELLVLDRLLYRNRSQHRSAKYFTLVLEVRRACNAFAAPKLPDLLAQGLGLIASVPDSRNGRAREAWVRSAAAGLSRMRVAAVACACSLESIVKASKHLAHQVSQTYFMALSTVFLACLARLFACNLHLGGRLLQIHGALLRTLLAQPCTSECLSASDMAECRLPEDTASFLSRLRGAGGAHKAARARNTPDSSSIAASAVAAAMSDPADAEHAAVPPPLLLTTPKSSSRAQRGGAGASLDEEDEGEGEGEDEDDTGEHVGRARTATEAEAGGEGEGEMAQAVSPAAENDALQRKKRFGRAAAVAAERLGGGGGRARAMAGLGAGDGGGTSAARKAIGGNGDSSGTAGKKGAGPAHKKVVLASEFSDSSSEDESDTEDTAATAAGGSGGGGGGGGDAGRRDREGATPPQQPADKAPASTHQAPTVSETSSEQPLRHQPSLFFSSTPRRPQQPRTQLNGHANSDPVAAATAISPVSGSGGAGTGDGIAAASATVGGGAPKISGVAAAPVPGQAGRVGWVIDPTPTPRPAPAPAVDASLSGRKRKGNKSGRGRGGGGRQAGAAAAAAVVTAKGEEVKSPDDGFREGATPSVSATPDATTPKDESTGVAVDAGEAEARANSGGGGGGGGGDSAATSTGIPALPSAGTSNPKDRGTLDDAKEARRRFSSDPKSLRSGHPGVVAQAKELDGAGAAEPPWDDSAPGKARGQPTVSRKKAKSAGSGGAGAKRSSSGEGLEEKSGKAKKQKKKKKTARPASPHSVPGGSGKRSGGGRNAIDDIFGSLL